MKNISYLLLIVLACIACSSESSNDQSSEAPPAETSGTEALLSKYTDVSLTTDLTVLSDNDKKVIPILIEVAQIMDELFWEQAYGKKDSLISAVSGGLQEYARINYGPWDRLDNNKPFIDGVGEKPAGANFYPEDMTKEEFEQASIADKTSLYTILRRNENGELYSIPYSQAYGESLQKAAGLLRQAGELTDDEAFSKYLFLRADALLSNDYYASDIAWMDMKSNSIDIITGPIETYEDQLFGYKAAFETYVLVKDKEWSARLDKYAAMLPELQRGLPVDETYKAEEPGSESQLNAYDVVYYAGDCNAGSKTIAVNLPNDEKVQLEKGTRRSQLKNAMRAKFDEILVPLAKELIDPSQRQYISFDAFFGNTMFHEVAHGLGIKNTVNGSGTVRESLKEHASALEEGKADVLGLYMVTALHEKGEIDEDLMSHYVTFMASIFRSVRFGASSAHGKANMIRFNYFQDMGAFSKNAESGYYSIDFDKMQEAMNALSNEILTIQGNGDYDAAAALVNEKAVIGNELQLDLDRLSALGIPVDIVFNQGVDVLGL
ncbi:dipeptidyl-peptidase 3 family protein [Fulvivirga sedimenti]|uniref:Zn-dependent hydrolase n=1 Tax=Fulvivirga sedimenti TaxID=2879465 RepID=A0A9X1HPD5_9BACT|nr:Zn-dependent hydrolase [Fulvivirga sedimenti]MCA6073747.1 Zn-dependent hydrolase [Fulvivirga sedimenti]